MRRRDWRRDVAEVVALVVMTSLVGGALAAWGVWVLAMWMMGGAD